MLEHNNIQVIRDLLPGNDMPVVCFIPGLMGDETFWQSQVVPLNEKGYSVVRLVPPGHGNNPFTNEALTLKGLATSVGVVLAELAEEGEMHRPVHLVGLSFGGIIAQCVALENRAPLASLVLCSTMASFPTPDTEIWRSRRQGILDAGNCVESAMANIQRWLPSSFKDDHPAIWQGIFDSAANMSPLGFVRSLEAIQGLDLWQNLSEIATPTLVIRGAEDGDCPLENKQRMASLIPAAEFLEIADCQHFPNIQQPELFNRQLIEWLDRH